VADVLEAQPAPGADGGRSNLWIELPPGYLRLPVTAVESSLAEAEEKLRALAPPDRLELLAAVVGTFTLLLDDLQQRNAAYCGLGWHTAADGAVVSSSLVVSLQRLAQRRNPRLLLGDLVRFRAAAGAQGRVDTVDLRPGPALFSEDVLALPRPRPPGQGRGAGPDAEVYRLQALVPSADGTKLAAVDFCTPDTARGPHFRAMIVLMADSVSFSAPPESGDADSSTAAGGAIRSVHRILAGPTQ
jgi:hypothetical protein